MRRSVFQAVEFGPLFEPFSLGPPFEEFQKWPILVSLLNLLELDFAGSFGGAVCVKKFSDNCSLSAC